MAMFARAAVIAAVLFGAGATVGCGGSASTPPPATAASAPVAPAATGEDETTAALREHHRYHHHGGVMLFIAMSLDTLGVSPEQRAAVEKIRTDLHARMEAAHAAEQNLELMLAEGVAGASFDAAKVDAAVAQATDAAATLPDASADALGQLHAVLTPIQRAALVDKVESHWAVWQAANADESEPAHPHGGHLARVAADLELTPDQVDKIRAGLGQREGAAPRFDAQDVATYLHSLGDAFRGEKFDARAFGAASNANAHLVHRGAAHMARFVEAVSAELTPDQRARFAQRLREHAAHNPSAEGQP